MEAEMRLYFSVPLRTHFARQIYVYNVDQKKGEKKKLILFLAQTTKKFNLQSRHVGVYYVINVMEKAG